MCQFGRLSANQELAQDGSGSGRHLAYVEKPRNISLRPTAHHSQHHGTVRRGGLKHEFLTNGMLRA